MSDNGAEKTQDLIKQVQQGDDAAWARLVHKFRQFLKRIARNQVACRKHQADASDVVQEALFNLHRLVQQQRLGEALDTIHLEKLLGQLVHHRAVDASRRHKPHLSLDQVCGDSSMNLDELGREDTVDAMDAAAVVLPRWKEHFIAELAHDLRKYASLFLDEGLKPAQIRERLRQAGHKVPGLRMVEVTVKKIKDGFIAYRQKALEIEP